METIIQPERNRSLHCKLIFKFSDLCAKKKIIEDMRLTLKEQEETQMEQDQVLEAKLEENERLVSGKYLYRIQEGRGTIYFVLLIALLHFSLFIIDFVTVILAQI